MRERRFLREPGSPWWVRIFLRHDGSARWRLTRDAGGRPVMILEPDRVVALLADRPGRAAHLDRARRALMDAILEEPSRGETLARDRRDLYLACGVCPGCGYCLLDLPPAGDILTCPECGRGWAVPPFAPI